MGSLKQRNDIHLLVAASLSILAPASASGESRANLLASQARLESALATLPDWIPSDQAHGRIGFHGQPKPFQYVMVDLGEVMPIGEVVLFPARPSAGLDPANENGFPGEIEIEVSSDEDFSEPIRLGRWQEQTPGSGTSLPFLRFRDRQSSPAKGRYVRVRVFGARQRNKVRGEFFTLGEVVVLSSGTNLALGKPVTSSGGITNSPRWEEANLTDGFLWCLSLRGREARISNGYHSALELEETGVEKWVEVDLGSERDIDAIHLVPAHPNDFADTFGFGFPVRFQLLGYPESGPSTLLFETGRAPLPNPGNSTLKIPIADDPLRRIRLVGTELWQRTNDFHLALAEMQVWKGGRNLAAGAPVTALDSIETGLWSNDSLVDGHSSRHELLDWNTWLDSLTRRAEIESELAVIAGKLETRQAETLRFWTRLGILSAIVIVLGFLSLLIFQRKQAARSREALRQRIAHDLHDELGASLSHLALQSDLACRQLAEGDPVRERLAGLSGTARTTLDNMRDVIWLLAPATDNWQGFRKRIESIAGRLLDGVDHEIRSEGDPPTGSPPIEWVREWVLFFKEAVTNARRHAEAQLIEIVLEWEHRSLTVLIRDDGRGFDPEHSTHVEGLGLRNLSRRATALRGELKIDSRPGDGTSIRLQVPLPDGKHS